MRIYTKTGDDGTTGLVGGNRIRKDSLRIAAIGDIDELNAAIGVACPMEKSSVLEIELREIQSRLFDLGAEIATPRGTPDHSLSNRDVHWLEESIDAMIDQLPPLRSFILPGGSMQAAGLHLARTVCRRAERSLLALHAVEEVRPTTRIYLNRLSDWLFVAARTANQAEDVCEIEWHPRKDNQTT